MPFVRWRSNNCPICDYSINRAIEAEEEQGLSSGVAITETMMTHIQEVHPDFLRWEKSKNKLAVVLGASTSLLTFLFFLFVVRLLPPRPPSSPGYGRGFAGISVAAFFLPLFVMNWLGYRRFRAEWREKGLPPTPTFSPRLGTVGRSSLDEDQAVIGIIKDLKTQLNIPYPDITTIVRWQTIVPQEGKRGVQVIRSDNCLIQGSTVYLAENMRSRLNPDDWRPIIASELIYSRKLGRVKSRGILARAVSIIILYAISWFLLPPLFAAYNLSLGILIIIGPFLILVAILIVALYQTKLRFVADRQASGLVGTRAFQASLRKIGQASPGDVAGIERRIENLNGAN